MWENIWINFIFILIGYLIGSILLSTILSKKLKGNDIREKGSLNAGSTNMLRVYGAKLALPVFFFDVMKPIVAACIAWGVKNETNYIIMPQLAAFGAVIGHIFPIFFKFKGGKGAASMLGFMIAFNLIITIVGTIIFIIIVWKTRYVSLGSILSPIPVIGMSFIPYISSGILTPLFMGFDIWVTPLIFTLIWLLVVFQHRGNIKRLINGTERKFNQKS